MTATDRNVGDRYRASRERLTALVGPLTEAEWETPVPACPGWRVRDVVAHLVGIIEDATAGRISGPPGPDQTADEVDRHRGDAPADLVARWTELAPGFERVIGDGGTVAACIDALSHEHDVRGALGIPGHRDDPDLRYVAELLSRGLPPGVAVDFPDGVPAGPADLRLRTDHFELFRLRLGRRSREQVVRLDWSADPGDVVDQLFVFGPAGRDVIE